MGSSGTIRFNKRRGTNIGHKNCGGTSSRTGAIWRCFYQTWWVVWLPFFYYPMNIGLRLSSQLTKSYFQRGGPGPPTSKFGDLLKWRGVAPNHPTFIKIWQLFGFKAMVTTGRDPPLDPPVVTAQWFEDPVVSQ